MKTRGLEKPGYVARMFAETLHSGEVEIWDVDERHLVLHGEADAIRVTHAGGEGRVIHDRFPEALDRFLKGEDPRVLLGE